MDVIVVLNIFLAIGLALYLVCLLKKTQLAEGSTLSWLWFLLAALSLCLGNLAGMPTSIGGLSWPGFQLLATILFGWCVFAGIRQLLNEPAPAASSRWSKEMTPSLAAKRGGIRNAFAVDRLLESPFLGRASGLGKKSPRRRRTANLKSGPATDLLSALRETEPDALGHSQRVAELAVVIGREMGLSDHALEEVRASGLLHDVGEIAVRPSVLHKSQRLTEDEWSEIKGHSRYGQRLLERGEGLPPVGTNVLYHHEKYDGTGYPVGLQGEEIPLVARIVAVADAFDAMENGRHYQEPRDEAEAVDELLAHAGTQFDPAVVRAFLRVIRSRRRQGSGHLAAV